MRTYLDFEKPIAELETKVAELRALSGDGEAVSIVDEITKLEAVLGALARRAGLDDQFPQGAYHDVRAAAVGDEVDLLHFGHSGDEAHELL